MHGNSHKDFRNMHDANNRAPTWSDSHSKENLQKLHRKSDSKMTLHSRLSSSDLAASRSDTTTKDDDGETPRPTSSELKEVKRIQAEARAREEEEQAEKKKLVEEDAKVEGERDGSISEVATNDDVVSHGGSNISFSEMPSDSVCLQNPFKNKVVISDST